MEDLKRCFADNLIRLRAKAGLTQAQLAEELHYSDKAVSKWERADALPDVTVVKAIADRFAVTVDYLLTEHEHEEIAPPPEPAKHTGTITALAVAGVYVAALLLFVIFWMLGSLLWEILLAAVPVSLITLLVLNSVWDKKKAHPAIVSLLVVSLIVLLYYLLRAFHLWQLFLLIVPALVIVFLSFRLSDRWRKSK